MTGLNSWLSPAVLHALGWALIHSLWQGAGVAALAALVMAFIRRPAVRYLVALSALALMLAAPVATFLVLAKPAAPVQVPQSATMPAPMTATVSVSVLPVTPPPSTPVAVFATADRAIAAIAEAPRQFPAADMLSWLVAAWACGVAFFSLRFAGGFLLLEHRCRAQSHSPGERVLALCLDLQRRLGLTRAIQYLECGWVEAPAVIGWLRPAVLLPVFALTGLSEEQFRAVIAHELAHIRRHDWFVNLFQVLVEALLFYHPAMWWLNRRIRIERELCCDEIAVSLTGNRLEYARALAQMAEWKNVSMLAMAANRGPLTQRILHILERKPGAGQRVAGLTGGMLFLVAALAAANLLFGIAYPIPAAKAEVRAVLVSSQNAALRLARQVFAVSGTAAKIAAPPMAAPDKVDLAAGAQPENLAAPSPDLSQLLPKEYLTTPALVASNAASSIPAPVNGAAAANDAPRITRCGNTSVFGRVLSPNAVEMQGFYCILSGTIGDNSSAIQSGSCPLASTYSYPGDPSGPFPRDPSRTYQGDMVGRLNRLKEPDANCPFDIQMNVRLADPADAARMKTGSMVRLAGDFRITRQNGTEYLSVTNARVTWADPFNRQAGANDPAKIFHCLNTSVFGRVVSPELIELQGFACNLNSPPILFGACPGASSYSYPGDPSASNIGNPSRGNISAPVGRLKTPKPECEFDSRMNVRLANPSDGAKMQPGKIVRVAGEFQVTRQGDKDYLSVANARVTWTDPFDRHAANAPPATPVQPSVNVSAAVVALHDQAVAPMQTARDPSEGPVQAASSTLPATAPRLDPNEPYKTRSCTGTVMGRVTSSTTIQFPRIACGVFSGGADGPGGQTGSGGVGSSGGIAFDVGPCSRSRTLWGAEAARNVSVPVPDCPNKPWFTMTVQLANPADASKMPLGKLVTLKGVFLLITQGKVSYLLVQNARVVYGDPFDRHAANDTPATPAQSLPNAASAVALNDQPVAPSTHDVGLVQAASSTPPPVMAAPMAGLSPAVTRTEPALACLLGLSHWLCQHDLFAMRAMMSFPRGVPNCVDDRHPNAWPKHPAFESSCPQGVLEAVDYLGRNARGDDVYKVQYSHSITTYVLQQPNPDGKVEEYWNVNIPSYIMAVPSQNAHKVALYRRPAKGSDPADRHAANASPAATPDNQPITLASAVAPGRASAPRTRTEPALACLLGFAPRECLNAFDLRLKQQVGWKIITCVDIGSVRHSYCPDGPVEAVNYLGANAAGADVYEVQCSHGDSVYVIEPPDANEKINHLWIKSGNLNAIVPSSLVAIISRAGAGLIYKRTATDGGAQADPTDRHAGDFQITRREGTDYVTLASAPGPGRDPRSRTELAMKCWLGLVGYKGCWQSLCGFGSAGPLERVEYLGRTAAGAEIYQVRYRYIAATAYRVAPDPKGKPDQYLVEATDPYWVKKEISSPAAPILIYARPEDAAPCIDHSNFGGQLNPTY